MRSTPIRAVLGLYLSVGALSQQPAEPWSDEQLLEHTLGFQQEGMPARLSQASQLLRNEKEATPAIVARIHGDHREYLLKVELLLDQLVDERWAIREQAERTLIEIGARAQSMILQRVENHRFAEEEIRCRRILEEIRSRGTTDEDRERKMLLGLATTALYMQPSQQLRRALRSALGHTESAIVKNAIRALGKHGSDDDADAVAQLIDWKGGVYRQAALSALARMKSARALEICAELIAGGTMTTGEICSLMIALRTRDDGAAILRQLRDHPDPCVAAGAALPPLADTETGTLDVVLTMSDRTPLTAKYGRLLADGTLVTEAVDGLASCEIPFAESDVLTFPGNVPSPTNQARVFLTQGSMVTGQLQGIDAEEVVLDSTVFGLLRLPRALVQGIAVDPELDRLVGASIDFDRVRLKSNDFVNGSIRSLGDGVLTVDTEGSERQIAIDQVAGMLMVRPASVEPDSTVFHRVELAGGDRIIGYIVDGTTSQLAVSAPTLGAATVEMSEVTRIEIGVGGGVLWGWTLIADYSDNRVVEVDDQGNIAFELQDIYGAWDAEYLETGNILVTEFSVSRVQEVNRNGEMVWSYEDLKNPYDADRLPNGNTLIADTFGLRVIEVDKAGEVVWKYETDIRPYDCDRLPNGNTLIADVLKDRVIEVSPEGEIVWEVQGMNNVHDADRLPNGNTLITLRSRSAVIEVDREGRVVWEIGDLASPSDADRLPNGHTVVAENTQVREFDRHGNMVWRKEMTWAVEVNRY
jgi:hypothetical protein